jgi:hypothetical protein
MTARDNLIQASLGLANTYRSIKQEVSPRHQACPEVQGHRRILVIWQNTEVSRHNLSNMKYIYIHTGYIIVVQCSY